MTNAARRAPLKRGVLALAALLVGVTGVGCREAQTPAKPAEATAAYAGPGRAVPIMPSQRHIPVGSKHEPYSTEPPTSGPHYNEPAKAGFYLQAPPDEQLVHSLQHGYIVIWYKVDDLSPAERDRLFVDIKEAMVAGGNSRLTRTPKLIAVPRPKLKSRLALTSWGHIDELDRFDRQQVLDFISFFRDEAPEPTQP